MKAKLWLIAGAIFVSLLAFLVVMVRVCAQTPAPI